MTGFTFFYLLNNIYTTMNITPTKPQTEFERSGSSVKQIDKENKILKTPTSGKKIPDDFMFSPVKTKTPRKLFDSPVKGGKSKKQSKRRRKTNSRRRRI